MQSLGSYCSVKGGSDGNVGQLSTTLCEKAIENGKRGEKSLQETGKITVLGNP
jgi:hypothetical protein